MTAPRLTKKAIAEIQKQERQAMREKQQRSAFVNTTGNRYRAMAKRAAVDFGVPHLPFELEDLRARVEPAIGKPCECGCGVKITVKSMAIDHSVPVARGGSWELYNLTVITKKCNWRKGIFLPEEYQRLIEFTEKLTPISREDLWRRLVVGGKFTFGK